MIKGKKTYQNIGLVLGLSVLITLVNYILNPISSNALPHNNILAFDIENPIDSPEIDLPFPFKDGIGNPDEENSGGLYLNNPSNVETGFEYDPETENYNYFEKIGGKSIKNPTYMDFEEYINYDSKKSLQKYWKEKAAADDINQTKGFRPTLNIKSKTFDRLFGGNTIDIRPQGSAELTFGLNNSTRDNPALPANQRSTTTFNFDQKIQLNVVGNIGEKLKLSLNYNTEATFDFENQMKIEYTGYEDEIIQKIEAGNVSLPLKGSLITGSQTLFGVKTELKFGRLYITSVLSQERGEKKEINVQGGAQIQVYEKPASDYEDNKHYFLSHYFRDNYENFLSSPPVVNSRANIIKVEVWTSNINNAIENTKNIIGFMDLGEATQNNIYNDALVTDANLAFNATFPINSANNLYANIDSLYSSSQAIRSFVTSSQSLELIGFENGVDFEKYENARLLNPSEYTINPQLGYISLNSTLQPDQILCVAFQYTLDGQVYQVGEFSTDGIAGQDALYVKLLKSSILNTDLPTWDLMMKNVYSLGAYNISPTDFFFNIDYLDPATGVQIPFIPEDNMSNQPIIGLMNLDRVNNQNQASPDGVFDFINGVNINANTGRVYFPVLEPFGAHLRSKFTNPATANKYAFDSLYTTTQTLAKQDVTKNRFTLKGKYSSSSSADISLNALNVPQGSVKVTAGGAALTENVDYTVDYNLGRVKIINDGILQSGTPIKISLESQSLFNIQTKTMMGTRLDYKISDKFNIGGTIINLSERPLTPKINLGDEPINNTIYGFDITYSTDAPFLTRWADKLPLYSTKEKSTLTLEGEFAHLLPGNPSAISKEGTAYLDDFEGSQSTIDLSTYTMWNLASTPQGQPDLFPEGDGSTSNTLAYGFNRAKLAWYVIDPLFWRNDDRTPPHIKDTPAGRTMQSNHYMREVLQTEVFPNKSLTNGIITNMPILDLAYYPTERGPYNFDNGTSFGSGIAPDGTLNNPPTRWGGIMRRIETTDFESSNVEFIQFWVMDPFNSEDGNPNHSGGQLYFNLGNISEDILKDSRKSFENGLPISAIDYGTGANINLIDTTIWGRVPKVQALVNAFDNTSSTRPYQDIGYDGFNDADEAAFFGNIFGADPSADNYHHYRGSDFDGAGTDILTRYKKFNGPEGNSPTSEQYTESYSTSATTRPNVEDINLNNNLDFKESYFQYVVNLSPTQVNSSNVGNNYITNVLETSVKTPDGNTKTIRWYQFKIPIREPEKVVGNIQDFKSIRFMRMFMKGFNEKVVLRFAQLELVRGEWRKYDGSLLSLGDYIGTDDNTTSFIISAVNIEENSSKTPVNYVIPPGILREINPNPTSNNTGLNQLNEQALSLNVCNLKDGDARAGFKIMDIDIRRYKKLKMFIHAEQSNPNIPLNDNDLTVFIRMGTDFNNNYYEYEVPLKVTAPGFYNKDIESDQYLVWPESNNIDLVFSKLTDIKLKRNQLMSDPQSGINILKAYEEDDGNNKIKVKGNPNLAEVRVFMIGIRNRKQSALRPSDDGLDKCAEIWVNELRMSDFDNEGGWAAQARMTAQIADLGNVTLAGNYSTPGFGSVQQKLNERQIVTKKSYDLSTGVELGKFIPEKIGISLPMYFSQTEGKITPKYNPLDPDILLNELLDNDDFSQEYRDSVGFRTEEYMKRRSINFTNVRKLRPKGQTKAHFYDVSNLSFNFGYSSSYMRNADTQFDTKKNYKGGFAYGFSNNPKNYTPFSDTKIAKKKAFLFVKEFNFYLAPKQLTFQTDVDRMYSERRARNNTGFDFEMPTYYQKYFYWNRVYALKFDLTKALTFNFNANNKASINEPLTAQGRVNQDYKEEYQQWKDTVYESFREFGINTNYHHSFSFNYEVPITKIPYLDFITLTASYNGDYDWQRAPIGADTLGHTIQNSNTMAFNAQLNMGKFYSQFKYLKDVEKRSTERQQRRTLDRKKPDRTKSQAENAKLKGWALGTPPATIQFDQKKFKDSDTSKVELWRKVLPFKPMDHVVLLLMSPKNISGTYTRNRGTLMPGYYQETSILGFNPNFSAPGFNFVSGIQEQDFAIRAYENGWLVPDASLLYTYNTTYKEEYNLRATVNPLKNLRIQLTMNRNYATNMAQQFFWNDSLNSPNGDYDFARPIETGNFSMSYMSIFTAFSADEEGSWNSSVFDDFLKNREIISQRRGAENPNSNGFIGNYRDGYSGTAQDVLIPTFLSAYGGTDPNSTSLGSFDKYIPIPNWRITYDGLEKIPLLNRAFKKISLNHSYRSTFNVSSFTTNLFYIPDGAARNVENNFISAYQISSVSISEQFGPLLGVDVTLENNILVKFEYKRDRNASLSMANNQITEVKGNEYSIGSGYTFRQIRVPFIKRRIQSDIDTRIDFSLRNNNTIIRKIVEGVNQLTSGQSIFSVKFTADYKISQKLNLRLFYDYIATNPLISTTFPTTNTNAGFSLRFILSQ